MILSKLNNLDLKSKTQIIISSYIVLSGLIVFFFLLPTARQIFVIKDNIIAKRVEQEKKLNSDQNYANLGSKIKEIESQFSILDGVYLDIDRKLEFITMLEGMAADNTVEQKLTIDLKFNSDGLIKKIPVIIEIGGAYQDVLNYLVALETLPYYINVGSFDLSQSTAVKEGEINRYNLRLSANTYWK